MAALANPAFLYIGSDKWTAVTAWPSATIPAAGNLVRQSAAPTLGNERVFVCVTETGATGVGEPTWVVTKGAKTTDNLVTWQECTGQPAVNGDATNTKDWNSAKSNTVALGQIIKNIAGTFYFICDTAGTAGSGAEPTWNTTAGQTTADNTVTWRSIGAVGIFGAFAAPHQRILNADAATWSTVAGSTCYVSSAHAETQSSAMTLAGGQGVVATPTKYVCVSNATSPPTAATTGATVSTTGVSNVVITGFSYYEGIAFQSGSVANTALINLGVAAASHALYFENCSFKINNTSAASTITMGTNNKDCLVSANNCTYVFGSVSQLIVCNGPFNEIIGGSVAATGSVPTTGFDLTATVTSRLIVRDCDLSALNSNLLAAQSISCGSSFLFENCKINASAVMSATFKGPGGHTFKMHNCDSGTKNYRFYESNYLASVQHETTTINNAGATDGTQRISFKIITSANTSLTQPYVSPEIAAWQDTTGSSKTATIEIAGASTLTNGDIWMEVEYMGSSATPIGSFINCRVVDIIAATANVPTSSASWGGSPVSTQKLQVTFTPQMKGPVKARVFVAKASATVYIDPLITIT